MEGGRLIDFDSLTHSVIDLIHSVT
jgi:hypothetical protein